jgi:ribosomal protein S18 acetylase RimI-like enzyme
MYINETTLTDKLKQEIYEGFKENAITVTGIDGLETSPLVFELRDDKKLLSVVVVQLFWGQLHIKYVFTPPAYRNKGYASKLMVHVFEYGKLKGCSFAFVETMSFQAPEFYQNLGFKIELKRDNYIKNLSFIYLKKDL